MSVLPRVAAVAVTMLTASVALAAPKKTEAPLPAPALKLTLAPGAAGASWNLQVVNEGDVPVRLAADVRLLSLEITAPGAGARRPTTVTCALPADVRPATDEGSELVIPPARSWSAKVDPLFVCFGAKERAALVAGASVRARLGFSGTARSAPFVAAPVGAGAGKIAAVRALEAAPITLSEAAAPPAKDAATAEPIHLTTPAAVDVRVGTEIATTVTLVNGSERAITVLARPEMVLFQVSGPAGAVTCGTTRQVFAPIRELYGRVPARGRVAIPVLVGASCPGGTFDEPGIYRVTPRLDLTGASARGLGLATWDGTASASAPMLVRVRSARRPTAPTKPTLD